MMQATRKPSRKSKAGNYWKNPMQPSFGEEENKNLNFKQQEYNLDNKDPPNGFKNKRHKGSLPSRAGTCKIKHA